jgi:hypothetical protein
MRPHALPGSDIAGIVLVGGFRLSNKKSVINQLARERRSAHPTNRPMT